MTHSEQTAQLQPLKAFNGFDECIDNKHHCQPLFTDPSKAFDTDKAYN